MLAYEHFVKKSFHTILYIALFFSYLEASFYNKTINCTVYSRGDSKEPLYLINLPENWQRLLVSEDEADTIVPIARFHKGELEIVLYNFPNKAIAPQRQIERWIEKSGATEEEVVTAPISCGGFSGLSLFAEHNGTALFAVALTCDREMICALEATAYDELFLAECISCVAIKCSGPKKELYEQKDEIEKCFRSFRLQKQVNAFL